MEEEDGLLTNDLILGAKGAEDLVPLVSNYIYKLSGRNADVAQEGFLALCEFWARAKYEPNPRAYLLKVIYGRIMTAKSYTYFSLRIPWTSKERHGLDTIYLQPLEVDVPLVEDSGTDLEELMAEICYTELEKKVIRARIYFNLSWSNVGRTLNLSAAFCRGVFNDVCIRERAKAGLCQWPS